MKYFFILLFIFATLIQKIVSQDTIAKTTIDTSPFKFSIRFGRYFYNSKPINEDKMHAILTATNDKKLHYLSICADVSKDNRRIGYLAIPAGIGCAVTTLLFGTNQFSWRKSPEETAAYQFSKNEYDTYLTVIGILASATISFPVISTIADRSHRNFDRQAMKLYNEKY